MTLASRPPTIMQKEKYFAELFVIFLCIHYYGANITEDAKCANEDKCLKQCCEPGLALNFDPHNKSSATPTCVPSPNTTLEEPVFKNVNQTESVIYGFPKCATNYIASADLATLPSPHCLGYLSAVDVTTVGVICEEDKLPLERKTTFRKCCKDDYKYDSKVRTCLQSPGFNITLFDFLSENTSGFNNFVYGMPDCSEVLTDFTLSDGVLVQSNIFSELQSGVICVDEEFDGNGLVGRRCVKRGNICGRTPCVRKCCPAGKHMNTKKCSRNDTDRGFKPTFYNTSDTNNIIITQKEIEYGLLHSDNCLGGMKKSLLKSHTNPNAAFFLSTNGSLYIPRYNLFYPPEEYCLEDVLIPSKGMDGMFAFFCYVAPPPPVKPPRSLKYILRGWGFLFSCVFLLATILVYSCLPSLQNLHGKTLMCHNASFFIASACIAFQLIGNLQQIFGSHFERACKVLGFVTLFAFLAAFAWLNVMCFDIWWTFGGVRSMGNSSSKNRERKRFAWYSLYAWGLATIITATASIIDNVDNDAPNMLKANMGEDTCFFKKGDASEFFYFITPVAIIVTCNMAFFVLTARNCSKVKAEIHRMQKSNDDGMKKNFQTDLNTLLMNCKLFVVMGVWWIVEVINACFPKAPLTWLYAPAEVFGALQGVLIFIIFVLKLKVLKALASRFGIRRWSNDGDAGGNNRLSCNDSRSRKISSTSTGTPTMTTIMQITPESTAISQRSLISIKT